MAAFAGFDEIRRQADCRSHEYGGCVFEVRPDVYRASHPARLGDDEYSVQFCLPPPAPKGTVKVAEFHNHPTKESFSKWDIPSNLVQYLLAPSGTIYKYTPMAEGLEKWAPGQWVRA